MSNSARIAELFEHGVRAGDRSLVLIGLPNDLETTRMAVAVGRRGTRTAVARNRLKRLCREAFRRELPALPIGLDLVLLPKRGPEHTVDALARSLGPLARRIARKIEKADRD
ncbi:MAG: ribonuclease P protein component [Planctomycetota bacterium]